MRKHTVFIGLYSLLSHLSLTTTSFFIDLLRENLFVNSVFFRDISACKRDILLAVFLYTTTTFGGSEWQ